MCIIYISLSYIYIYKGLRPHAADPYCWRAVRQSLHHLASLLLLGRQ